MKNIKFVFILIPVLIAFSCGQKSEGTDAEVSEAKEVMEVGSSAEYTIDEADSKITWIGSKPTGKHNGTIPINEGMIALKENEIVGGKILIDVSNLTNQDLEENSEMRTKLVNHLKSDAFFHIDSFPQAEFVITKVVEYNPQEAVEVKEEYDTEYKPMAADEFIVNSPTHKVTGNLKMRGKALSVTFPAEIKIEEKELSAKAKFNIDRTNWGLNYRDEANVVDRAKDQFIYNTVNVGFNIVAKAAN